MRNLTRYQKELQHQIQSEKNRVNRILQKANIKITSVLSDVFGVAGLNILNDLANGITDPVKLAGHFDHNKRLAAKKAEAVEALNGRFKTHHQFMLKTMLEHIDFLESWITYIEAQVEGLLKDHQREHKLLQTIPGVKEKAANAIIPCF